MGNYRVYVEIEFSITPTELKEVKAWVKHSRFTYDFKNQNDVVHAILSAIEAGAIPGGFAENLENGYIKKEK